MEPCINLNNRQQGLSCWHMALRDIKIMGCFHGLPLGLLLLDIRPIDLIFHIQVCLKVLGDFERPDLFELDTWNKQVEDLEVLTTTLKQEGLPLILVGHSRGGVACLLATGRGKVNASHIITLSAPSTCNSISPEQQELLLREGSIVSPSSRTGQELRVGKGFLQEQLDDSSAHDLLPLISTIQAPVLVIHGCNDPSVPHIAATAIHGAAKNSSLVSVEGGDHVFNTPNPFPALQGPSAQLGEAWDSMKSWLQS